MDDGAGELGRISGQVDRNREAVEQMRIEMAVQAVRFDLYAEHAPNSSTLEKLESKIMTAVGDQMTQANAQQSRDILGRMDNLFRDYKAAQKDAQLESQNALLGAIQQRKSRWLWWALGIVAGIIVAVVSTAFGVWLAGVLESRS